MKDLKEQLEEKMINEGNPNNQPETIVSDQESKQAIKQAMKDDQALASVAQDIKVTVKDGQVTLNGEVSTKEQSNLASNTAKAVGVVDQIENNIEVIPSK
jgi:osmotically-inducible protein OsmY